MRANQDLRRLMRSKGVDFWMVASWLCISERAFSKIMSKELDEEAKQDVLVAINRAVREYHRE